MKEQKITKATLLQSKAKIIADRNKRFAVIKEEVDSIENNITNRLNELSQLIKLHIKKS